MIKFHEKINREKCEHLKDEDLPSLVLAIKNYDVKLKHRDWKYIAHQTAGIACNSHYMIGTILKPRDKLKTRIQMINDCWLDSCCGVFGRSLDEIIKYRYQINDLFDVDCNNSFQDFEEGIYPIDCTIENIKKMSSSHICNDFYNYICKSEKCIFPINLWNFYILGQNCD